MNEDLGRIEDLTKKYGSNFSITLQDTANGDLWKVKKKKSFIALKNVIWSERGQFFS